MQTRYAYGDSFHSMTPVAEGDEGGIECVTLDAHLAGMGIARADVMKVDVEGAELACLKGASGLIWGAGRPYLMLEYDVALCRRFGNNVFETLAYLDGKGYVPEQIAAHDWVARPMDLGLYRRFIFFWRAWRVCAAGGTSIRGSRGRRRRCPSCCG